MTSCGSHLEKAYIGTTRKFAGAKEIKSRLGKVITRRGCTQGKAKMSQQKIQTWDHNGSIIQMPTSL